MGTKLTKIELEQINTSLANQNLELRTELSVAKMMLKQQQSKQPVYVSARPGFKRALERLAQQYPERKSFTQDEVLNMAKHMHGGK